MRLLLIADLHGDLRKLERLLLAESSADLLLAAGDLTDFGGEREADLILDCVTKASLPFALVPGNCDKDGARRRFAQRELSADGRALARAGLLVAGVGGGTYRTGLTPYELREEELEEGIEAALSSTRRRASPGAAEPLVLLSHAPPYGYSADLRHHRHVGSPSLARAYESYRPVLHLCGHIHESRSAEIAGPGWIVNPGPLHEGCYAVAELLPGPGRPSLAVELRGL